MSHAYARMPQVLTDVPVESYVADAAPGERVQFERNGFFCVDTDSTPGAVSMNRIVTLADRWQSGKAAPPPPPKAKAPKPPKKAKGAAAPAAPGVSGAALADLEAQIAAQGDAVREAKAGGADKAAVDAAVAALLALKAQLPEGHELLSGGKKKKTKKKTVKQGVTLEVTDVAPAPATPPPAAAPSRSVVELAAQLDRIEAAVTALADACGGLEAELNAKKNSS